MLNKELTHKKELIRIAEKQNREDPSRFRIAYLPVNMSWVLLYSSERNWIEGQIIPVDNKTFWMDKDEFVDKLASLNLIVLPNNEVQVVVPNENS